MKTDKHFISYSRTDSADFVVKLASDLKARGINVWLDQQDIRGGAVWDLAVQQALENADCVIIVLSKASVASANVLDEVSYALKNNKRVIPVLKDDCKIPFRLDRIQHIDFRQHYQRGLQQLAATLADEPPAAALMPQAPTLPERKKWPWMVAGLVVLALGVYLLVDDNGNAGNQQAHADTTATEQAGDLADSIVGAPTEPATQQPPPTENAAPPVDDNMGFGGRVLFSSPPYGGRYTIDGDVLKLQVTAPESFPSLQFDVNRNGIIDANVDRSYGIAGGSKSNLCAQFLLSASSSTTCGGAPSNASLALEGDVYTFSIPLSELNSSDGQHAAAQVQLYHPARGRSYFPEGSNAGDFSKVYVLGNRAGAEWKRPIRNLDKMIQRRTGDQ